MTKIRITIESEKRGHTTLRCSRKNLGINFIARLTPPPWNHLPDRPSDVPRWGVPFVGYARWFLTVTGLVSRSFFQRHTLYTARPLNAFFWRHFLVVQERTPVCRRVPCSWARWRAHSRAVINRYSRENESNSFLNGQLAQRRRRRRRRSFSDLKEEGGINIEPREERGNVPCGRADPFFCSTTSAATRKTTFRRRNYSEAIRLSVDAATWRRSTGSNIKVRSSDC